MAILLFDSDPVFPQVLAPYLRERRFEVLEATTYPKAAEILATASCQVVLANRFMPDIDVYAFLRRHAGNVPIILYADVIFDRMNLLMANAAGVVVRDTTAILFQLLLLDAKNKNPPAVAGGF
ncbi:response regulator [Chitinophaga sp. sic0106]|uniref:response regulator n=1 Tax=Chitinophaga sp. sic0106 TaxID=2854785 RepID=UPI001C455783|nr:response regulator [Chitinophaga sp. sic0106]MBV7531358.1 response regulator [Chitinophaga sp. sic0106]